MDSALSVDVFCPKCGNKTIAGDSYCSKCGNPLARPGVPSSGMQETAPQHGPFKSRPTGLTIIAILWILFGLVNVVGGLDAASTDLNTPLPSASTFGLNSSQIAAVNWLQSGIWADSVISLLVFCVGIAQIFVVYGLWTGKPWSYRGALAVLIIVVLLWASRTALYSTAPSLLGLSVLSSAGYTIGSLIWLPVYLWYFRSPHVRVFLGLAEVPADLPREELYESSKNALVVKETGGTSDYVLDTDRVVKLGFMSTGVKILIWIVVLALFELGVGLFFGILWTLGAIGFILVAIPYGLIRNGIVSRRRSNPDFIASIETQLLHSDVIKAEMRGSKVAIKTMKKTLKFKISESERGDVGDYLQQKFGDRAQVTR